MKAGQLLAEIETPEVDQQLQQARSQLNTAKANYNLSQITSNRYQDLKNTDSVAQQDVDNALGSERANAATVAAAEYQVKYLEQLESFKNIYAPFDGIITVRNTDVGHLINSGAGTAASELFHIAAIRTLRVYINVPQQFSPAAKARVDRQSDASGISRAGNSRASSFVRRTRSILATRTLLVEVDVDNPTGELLPGALRRSPSAVPSGAPTFILPVSALIFRAQGLQVGNGEGRKPRRAREHYSWPRFWQRGRSGFRAAGAMTRHRESARLADRGRNRSHRAKLRRRAGATTSSRLRRREPEVNLRLHVAFAAQIAGSAKARSCDARVVRHICALRMHGGSELRSSARRRSREFQGDWGIGNPRSRATRRPKAAGGKFTKIRS